MKIPRILTANNGIIAVAALTSSIIVTYALDSNRDKYAQRLGEYGPGVMERFDTNQNKRLEPEEIDEIGKQIAQLESESLLGSSLRIETPWTRIGDYYTIDTFRFEPLGD